MKKLGFVFVICLTFLLTGCAKNYSVQFETNGAGEVEAIIVEKGLVIELPTVSKTGFDFLGWFTDENFETSFSSTTPIDGNMTLFAKWQVKTFNVIFKDYDDRIILTRENIEYGQAATAPADPVREGYDFLGWSETFDNVTHAITTIATYEIQTYEVYFYDADGVAIGDVQLIDYGQAATVPADPVREGYDFTGWDHEFSMVTADLEIYPEWQIQVFVVEFQDSDGTRMGELQQINYGEAAIVPDDPTKTGFIFDCWDKDSNNVIGNMIVKAIYTIQEYTISYYDGAILLTHLPDFYTVESHFTLPEYHKTGYLFMGWFEDSALTTKVESIAIGKTGAMTYYGKWLDESQTYTINYELNGGGWTWNIETVAVPGNGIDAYSNLPEQMMADYYMYLKDNNLLNSSLVDSTLQKTTWANFSANYTDPVAIYNHTTTNTSANSNGYSQLFYTSATGNIATHEVLTIDGGFFGTEPYKTKYANLLQYWSMLLFLKAYGSEFWEGASAKSLAGFVLDGYFYGTQGSGSGDFALLRGRIPNTNLKLVLDNGSLVEESTTYEITSYVQGLAANLAAPIRDGYYFAGWYEDAGFTGNPVWTIEAGVTPASQYYAKWLAYSELQ
ncbi:MAG: InlB B-repeat-containing protein [Bacilli bacterium]